ncbi:MAG: prepilin-type N-terminal cleavage/methylation domain-containing protein [Thermoleophilia bacterium]
MHRRRDTQRRGLVACCSVSGVSGFSLVELLVTILIVSIVFAAMVPLFVHTQQAAAGDAARNVALNIAQDRIEQIRQADFSDITTAASLESLLGTSWTSSNGKEYTITYSVTLGTENSTPHAAVGVTVTWSPPPSPVKAVTLTTIVANPAGEASVSTTPSPSVAASATPAPSLSPSVTASPSTSPSTAVGNLQVTTDTWNNIASVAVVRTDVTPSVAFETKTSINPNSTGSANTWSNLPVGTYLVSCTCCPAKPKVLTQTATITSGATSTVSFNNLPWWW